MNKLNNRSNYLKLIMGLFLIVFFVVSGTYAYFTWNSTDTKLVLVNTSKELSEYIVYDEGESKFIGDFQVGDSYLDGMYTTISIYKTEEVADLDLYATINMDINAIGDNISNSSAIKWTLTKGNSTNPTEILASGNFLDAVSGESFPLHSNIEVTTTLEEYTVWLWINAAENPSSELTGETIDTTIWTQVEQLVNDKFEITRLSNKAGKINATVVNPQGIITSYQVTTSSDEPTEWVTIATGEQSNEYLLEYPISNNGTYYVWFKDDTGKVINKSIDVTSLDSTPPTGTLSASGSGTTITASLSSIVEQGSGIKEYQYIVQTSSSCPSSGYISSSNTSYTFTRTTAATYYVCARIVDNAGNISSVYSKSVSLTLKPVYTYNGTHELIDDGNGNWRIKLKSSGTLKFTNLGSAVNGIDVFLVGGGGAGGGGGGGGGYTNTVRNISVAANTNYTITVGLGGTARGSSLTSVGTAGGQSSAFNYYANGGNPGGSGNNTGTGSSGGSGGSGGGCTYANGGSDGSNGKKYQNGTIATGQGTTTREFGESGATLYAGGGGGSGHTSVPWNGHSYYSSLGGDGGGGAGGNGYFSGYQNGVDGTDGLGGGGGGNWNAGNSGAGGDGIVIIRNRRISDTGANVGVSGCLPSYYQTDTQWEHLWGGMHVQPCYQEEYYVNGNYSIIKISTIKFTSSMYEQSMSWNINGTVKINGVDYTYSGSVGTSDYVATSWSSSIVSEPIYHNSDGTKSINISLTSSDIVRTSAGTTASWSNTGTLSSQTVTLTDIIS